MCQDVWRVERDGITMRLDRLETHYLFPTRAAVGIGPFVAVQPGSEGAIINAFAAGVMVGLIRIGSASSFNLGVGYGVDARVRVLGGELVEGQPAPRGTRRRRAARALRDPRALLDDLLQLLTR